MKHDWYQEWGLSGERADLNDPATYTDRWFPQGFLAYDAEHLRSAVRDHLALAIYYMTVMHPDWNDETQLNRIRGFATHFEREVGEPDRFRNKKWLLKQLFMVRDQTSNLV